MDIEDLRRRFASAELARAIPQEVDGEGRVVQVAVPAVTVRAIRSRALPNMEDADVQVRADYGPLSNQQLFNNVFAVEPVFKQFVVSTCDIGIFRNRPSHVNCVKMIQLLCMARLHLKNVLVGQAVVRQSFYQSMAMGEALGPFIPAAWKLPQPEARAEIIRAVEWLISPEGVLATNLDAAQWFDAELLGVDPDILEDQEIPDAGVALVLLEAMAIMLPSNNAWLNGISFIASALLSLTRRGTVTDELRARVEQGIRDATSAAAVNLGATTIKRFYTMYCTQVDAGNAQRLFAHYQNIIPDDIIALRNLVLQAAGSGLTTYMVILRAFADFSDFPWARLMHAIGPDFRKFADAVTAVGGNLYFGFNHQMAAAAARNFPSLAYTSFQLCIRAGGDNPLKRYGGMPKVIPGKLLIDQLLTTYIETRNNDNEDVAVPAAVVAEWQQLSGNARLAYRAMVAPPADEARPA